jgi:hypothetical protein
MKLDQSKAVIIAALITGVVGVLITGYFQIRQARIPIKVVVFKNLPGVFPSSCPLSDGQRDSHPRFPNGVERLGVMAWHRLILGVGRINIS